MHGVMVYVGMGQSGGRIGPVDGVVKGDGTLGI